MTLPKSEATTSTSQATTASKTKTKHTMNITIARRFNTLLQAVTELGVDISYNPREALKSIRNLETYRGLEVVSVFADEANQVWYVIKSLREGLMLLHKYEPFHSCLSDAPFEVYEPMANGARVSIDQADRLVHFARVRKSDGARRIIAKENLLAA